MGEDFAEAVAGKEEEEEADSTVMASVDFETLSRYPSSGPKQMGLKKSRGWCYIWLDGMRVNVSLN